MKKWILIIVLFLMTLGIGCRQVRPRKFAVVRLPDGSTIQFIAATYGTNAPIPSQQLALDKLGYRTLPRPPVRTVSHESNLVVWLERTRSSNAPRPAEGSYICFLGNGRNFVSGPGSTINLRVETPLVAVSFKAFPRREREIKLNIFQFGPEGHAGFQGAFSFPNPQYREYPKWNPEPLPATRHARDVDVTLSAFETGFANSKPVKDHTNKSAVTFSTNRAAMNYSAAELKFQSLSDTNAAWRVTGMELADAAGNVVSSDRVGWYGPYGRFAFAPSLWPDERAWRLKLMLKREKGFARDELLVFRNVPLPELRQTNYVGWSSNVAGITFTFKRIWRRPPVTRMIGFNPSELTLSASSIPEDLELNPLDAVYDNGKTNRAAGGFPSRRGNDYTYYFGEFPAGAKTADFSFSVQRQQTVEFMVRPDAAKGMAHKEKM